MKILLAVDSTPASQFAINELTELPWPEETHVEVLTVAGIDESAYGPAKEFAAEATVSVRDAGIHAHGNVAAGDPKAVILDRAAGFTTELIFMGAHRASAITDLFLDNAAGHIVRHASCSVAVARARVDDTIIPRRILLATDGSEGAEAAAFEIASRPWPVRSEVRVLSVVEVILPAMHALFDPPFYHSEEVQRLREEALIRAQNAVARAVEILTPAGLPLTESVSVLLDGTKEVILQEALNWGADWVFLGPGEIAESIAMDANCSVEIVRHASQTALEM